MAETSGQDDSLNPIRQQIAHSRDWLARDLSGLRYELDFPRKIRRSFQRQTVVWIAAAVVLGIVITSMPARTRKISVDAKGKSKGKHQKEGILGAGLALGILKLAGTLLKPVVVSFITKKMGGSWSRARTPRKW